MTPALWTMATCLVTSGCVILALVVGWAMGRTDKVDRTQAQRAEDRRIRKAVDQLDPGTLETLPFDQETPVRRRDHRRAPR